jgi:hypothetical protein
MIASQTSVPPRARRTARALVAALAGACALIVAACGSSNSAGGAGATHDTPDGAVRGLVAALTAFDGSDASINTLLQWIAPSQNAATKAALQSFQATGAKVTFKVDNFDVASVSTTDPTTATVTVKGTASACLSLAGGVGTGINTCQPLTDNTFKAAKENGTWYVKDFGPGAGGSSSTSSSSSSAST